MQSENKLYDLGLNPVPRHFKRVLREANIEFRDGIMWNDTLSCQQPMIWVEPGVICFVLNSEFRSLPTCQQVFALREYQKDSDFLEAFKTARKLETNGGVSFVRQQYEHWRTERICGTQPTKS